MEVNKVIRRQYFVTFEEEEAQNIRAFLTGLQESDYQQPFQRNNVDPEQQAATKKAVKDFTTALAEVPFADSDHGTQRL